MIPYVRDKREYKEKEYTRKIIKLKDYLGETLKNMNNIFISILYTVRVIYFDNEYSRTTYLKYAGFQWFK